MPRKRRAKEKAANKEDPLIGALRSAATQQELAKHGGKTGNAAKFMDLGETATATVETAIPKGTPEEEIERVLSLEQLMKKARVDLSIWEPDRPTINSWEMACYNTKTQRVELQDLFQFKTTLRRKIPKRYQDGLDWVAERLSKKVLRPIKPPAPAGSLLFEPSIYDAQIGRYSWAAETGQDVDVESATAVYENAMLDMIARIGHCKISRILFPVGHDLFEVDNWENTTAKGTPQDVDTRFPRVYGMAYEAIDRCVARLATIAPVEVVYLKGNHDPATSFYLCHALSKRFAEWEQVTVDLSPKSRKYFEWGINLIGMVHGNKEKPERLSRLMPEEMPEAWARTKYREWHTGHYHRAQQIQYVTVNEFGGIRHRTLPSIAGTNRYTFEEGYSTLWQAAEGYLWDRDDGYFGHFSVNARET